jgi:hypothetical protein
MQFIARRERIAYHPRNKDDRRKPPPVARPRWTWLENMRAEAFKLLFQSVAAGVQTPDDDGVV